MQACLFVMYASLFDAVGIKQDFGKNQIWCRAGFAGNLVSLVQRLRLFCTGLFFRLDLD
jgi:hypothetical protein